MVLKRSEVLVFIVLALVIILLGFFAVREGGITGAFIGLPVEVDENLSLNETTNIPVANETINIGIPIEEDIVLNETNETVPVLGEIDEEEKEYESDKHPKEKIPLSEEVTEESIEIEEQIDINDNIISPMAAPSVSALTINSSSDTNTSSENISLYWTISGGDGDWVKNITNWRLNGTPIAVLNMPFENASGNQTGDYSGFENNGSEQGGLTFNSTGGYDGKGAFEFDGIDDVMVLDIDSAPEFDFETGPFSVSLWVYATPNATRQHIIGPWKDTSNTGDWRIYLDSTNTIKFQIWNSGGTGNGVVTSSSISTGWYHLVGTRLANGSLDLYVNGDFDKSATATANASASLDLRIGEANIAISALFNGTIDEIMIFNHSLSADQIRAIYDNKTYLISSDETSLNDNWSACITPNDGTQDGTISCSKNLTVLSAAPNITNPTILPSSAYTNTNLTTSINYTDYDNDTGTVYFLWYKNGTNIHNQTNASIVDGTTVSSTLNFNNFSRDDLINVSIYANDGTSNSSIKWSSVITILNSPPTQGTPTINTTLGNNATENLTVYNVSTVDNDSDLINNIFNWLLNGTSITVLNMPFENISTEGYNATKDYSGYNNNGSEHGDITFNATGGYDGKGAYEFDGDGDHIIVADDASLDLTSAITVSVWVKPTGSFVNGARAFDKYSYAMWFSPTGIATFYTLGLDDEQISSVQTVPTDEWTHLAATYDSSTGIKNIYVNGTISQTETGITGTITTSAANLLIGDRSTGARALNGTIDEVMVFNSSLSAEQIKIWYENRTDMMAASEISDEDNWSGCITPNDGHGDGITICSSLVIKAENDNPSVFGLIPTINTNYNIVDTDIELAANVTDDSLFSVTASISLPNGTTDTATLSLASGDKYNISYLIKKINGTYNVTFIARDASDNTNSTETTNFTIDISNLCGNDICDGTETLDSCSLDCGYLNLGSTSDNNTASVIFLDSDLSSGISERIEDGTINYRTLNSNSYLYFKVNTSSLSLEELGVPYRDAILEVIYKDVFNETNCVEYSCTYPTNNYRPYIQILLEYGSPAVISYLTTDGIGGANNNQWNNTTLFIENTPRQELRSINGTFNFRIFYPLSDNTESLPIDYIRFKFVNSSEFNESRETERASRELIRSDYIETNVINQSDHINNYVTYVRNYLEKIYLNTIPTLSEITTELNAFEIKGNYEPVTFGIYAFEDLNNVNISITNLINSDNTIPIDNSTIDKVVLMDKKWRFDYNSYYGTNPWYLDNFTSLNISAGSSQQIWLTVYVPESTSSGNYTGTITISGDNINSSEIDLTLEVFDLSLEEPDAIPIAYHSPYYRECLYSATAAAKNMAEHDITPIVYFNPTYNSSYIVNFSAINYQINLSDEIDTYRDLGILIDGLLVSIVSTTYSGVWYDVYGNRDYFIGNSSEFDVEYKSILNQTKNFFKDNYGINISVSFADEPGTNELKRRVTNHLNRLSKEISLETWVAYSDSAEKPLTGHEFHFIFQLNNLSNNNPPSWLSTDASIVAYWNFSNSSIDDESGNGNNGSLIDNAYVLNGDLFLDGEDDVIDYGNNSNLDFSDSITVVAWAKINNTLGAQTIFANSAWTDGYGLLHYQSKFCFFINNLTAYKACISFSPNDDGWHHVVGMYNKSAGIISIYLDGIPGDTLEYKEDITYAANHRSVIGKLGNRDSYYFNGTIGEVSIFNRSLSEKEILELANFSSAENRELNITLEENYSNEMPESIFFTIDNRTQSPNRAATKKIFVNNQLVWNATNLDYRYQSFNISISDYLVNGTNNFTFSFVENLSHDENFSLYFIQDFWRNRTWDVVGNGTFWNYSYTSDNGDLSPVISYLDNRVNTVRVVSRDEIQRAEDAGDLFSYYTTYPANQPVIVNNRFLHGIYASALNVSNVFVYGYCDWRVFSYDPLNHPYNLIMDNVWGKSKDAYALVQPSWDEKIYNTLPYESLREGIEDSRIIATLKKAIVDYPGTIADEAQVYLNSLYSNVNHNYSNKYYPLNSSESIQRYADRSGEMLEDLSGNSSNFSFFDSMRKTMINYIVDLQAITPSTTPQTGSATSSGSTSSNAFQKFFSSIQKRTSNTIAPAIANLNKITFQTKTDLQNQQITVEKVTSAPSASDKVFHSFFKITANEISKNLENAKIYFEVEKSWLVDRKLATEDLALFHWDGDVWNELPTRVEKESESLFYYVSETSSFSYFAIGMKEKPEEIPSAHPDQESALKSIEEANILLNQAKEKRLDTREAESFLEESKKLYEQGEYQEASRLAEKVKKILEELLTKREREPSFWERTENFFGRAVHIVIKDFKDYSKYWIFGIVNLVILMIGLYFISKLIKRRRRNKIIRKSLFRKHKLIPKKHQLKTERKLGRLNKIIKSSLKSIVGKINKILNSKIKSFSKNTKIKTNLFLKNFIYKIKKVIKIIINSFRKKIFKRKKYSKSMNFWLFRKKENELKDIEEKVSLIKGYKKKTKRGLKNLNKWLKNKKISESTYKERKCKLLKLISDYNEYLNKSYKKIKEIKKNTELRKNESAKENLRKKQIEKRLKIINKEKQKIIDRKETERKGIEEQTKKIKTKSLFSKLFQKNNTKRLRNYLKKCKKTNMTKEQIKSSLRNKGWPEELVNKYLR